MRRPSWNSKSKSCIFGGPPRTSRAFHPAVEIGHGVDRDLGLDSRLADDPLDLRRVVLDVGNVGLHFAHVVFDLDHVGLEIRYIALDLSEIGAVLPDVAVDSIKTLMQSAFHVSHVGQDVI